MNLNLRSYRLFQRSVVDAERLKIGFAKLGEASVLDFGVEHPGGLEAGIRLAEICLAGLAEVTIQFQDSFPQCPLIRVRTDHPLAACVGAQYAGWEFQKDDFFAMVSGPARCLRAKQEKIVVDAGICESSERAVAIMESRGLPTADVVAAIADQCSVQPSKLSLCLAPTASFAGTIQIVARSIETAIHKMHELGFPIETIQVATGSAPIPLPGKDDLVALGWTNDSILYGSQVILWVRDLEDELRDEFGPRIPSCSSNDFGTSFLELFNRYDRDFYKMDRMLFSPAEVTLIDTSSGRTATFGETRFDIIRSSMGL